MNRTHIEIDVHRLNDGGLLLSYDGNSHTTYMKEEIDRYLLTGPPPALPADRQLAGDPFPLSLRYRITIGNKTCDFEKEKDPTVLRSPSAGKLLQYTVDDGGHVAEGNVFAEIEVSSAKEPGGAPFLQRWWMAKMKPSNAAAMLEVLCSMRALLAW